MRHTTLAAVVLMAALGAGSTSAAEHAPRADGQAATTDLTAHRIRIGDHPAFVRVVVDFTDGTLGSNDSEAVDPDPFADGRVAVDVRHRRVQAQAAPRTAHGVRVRITQADNRIRVRLNARAGRFKYLARTQLATPQRVVLDLYKSRPPRRGAEIVRAPDGCLELAGWSVAPRHIRAFGTARFLFENSFQILVRDSAGRPVGDRVVTVGESGRWRRGVPYRVSRRQSGTLEAMASSARDGALDCLVQTRVRLRP